MKHIEDAYQMTVIAYANWHWWGKYLYHIPNGGKRNKREAARLKALGVRPGVHDLHLPLPNDRYKGVMDRNEKRKGTGNDSAKAMAPHDGSGGQSV